MKARLLRLWLPVLLAAFGATAAALAEAPTDLPTGAVSGRIYEARTHAALGYGNVIVLATRRGAQTDSAGWFVITGLEPGSHTLRGFVIGFAPETAACEVRGGETTHVDLAFAHAIDGAAARRFGPALRESLGADVPGAADSLVCTIKPFCSHVWLGERPRFRVLVQNRSTRAVVLARDLDGSEWGRRPRIRFSFDGPPGGVHRRPQAVCGNVNPLELADLEVVRPGGTLELFGRGGRVDAANTFERPGVYVARVEYATDENDLRAWLGDTQPETLGEPWRSRFRQMPRVDLHAECAFEVQQR